MLHIKGVRRTVQNKDEPKEKEKLKKTLPPWITHFQHTSNGVAKKYKVGDTKVWQEDTRHYCDCPNHKDKVRWHTHPAKSCRTRKRWLEAQKNKISVNKGIVGDEQDDEENGEDKQDAQEDQDEKQPSPSPTAAPTSDVTTLLASALNPLMQDNTIARDLVADAINAANE